MDADKMVAWNKFKDAGLLWWINSMLHLFGWAIVYEMKEGKIIGVYPLKVKYRGFDEAGTSEGFKKVTNHLKENIDNLIKDCE